MRPNMTFGMGTLYIDGAHLGTLSTGQMSTVDLYDPLEEAPFITSIFSEPIELEMGTTIDSSTLKALVGSGPNPNSFTFTYPGTCLEQIRRHKKKRINKKWAKRYGYRAVACTYQADNAKLSDSNDGTIEFRTDTLKVVKWR